MGLCLYIFFLYWFPNCTLELNIPITFLKWTHCVIQSLSEWTKVTHLRSLSISTSLILTALNLVPNWRRGWHEKVGQNPHWDWSTGGPVRGFINFCKIFVKFCNFFDVFAARLHINFDYKLFVIVFHLTI